MQKTLGIIVGDNHDYGRWIRSRFTEEASRTGRNVVFIDPNKEYLQLQNDGSTLGSLPCVDAVLRTETFHTVARLIEQSYIVAGVKTQHGPKQFANVVNQYTKYHLYIRMVEAGVPIPDSFFVSAIEQIDAACEYFGNAFPLILKVEGIPNQRHGNGVVFIDSKKAMISTVETMLSFGYPVLVQRFIAERSGSDTRVIVIDGKIMGAIQRTGNEGDFRSNIHRGGSAVQVELSPRQREICETLAEHLQLGFIGIDLLGDPENPFVTEYNSPCQFQVFESTSGINIADALMNMMLAD